MKKLFTICVFALASIASALADGVSIAPFTIAAGETQDVDIVLEDEGGVYVSAQFNLYLPDGIGIVYDGTAYAYTSPHSGSSFVGVSKRTDRDGNDYYQFYLEDRMMNPLGAGTMFTVTLEATDMVSTGVQTGYIRSVSLVDEMGGGPDIAELTYDVTTSVDVTVSDLGYASFSWPRTLDFSDSGIQAFIGTRYANGSLLMSEVTVVPANTGVILKGAAGTYNPQTTDGPGDDVTENILTGTGSGSYTVQDGDNIYVLSNLNGAGLYFADPGVTVGAHKAYLALDSGTDAKDGGVSLDFNTTGIGAPAVVTDAAMMRNSYSQGIYTIDGRRVCSENLKKGVYISNGKKVLVK